ncbi:uncharacterized protein LOC134178035 [Corticium candelabrum]|uniref:uncharacterized protein LOC134178035 n=1 Tax=Corticium candelabrum TaxID=121492 RepID=UPI002E26DF28|nr:uncharacterized protein LOC134178035 [Corticium candelabrum]
MNVTKIIAPTCREDPRNIHSGIPGKSRKCDKDVVELHCATDIPPKMRRLQPFYILSSHEQKEVDQMMATALDKIAGDRQLSDSNFPGVITVRDLAKLQPNKWLNDNLINAVSCLWETDACREGRKVKSFNTYFYVKLDNQGPVAVRQWTMKQLINIFHYDVLLIPMHMPVKQHWCYTVTLTKENYVATEWTNEVVKNAPRQQDGSRCGVYCLMYMRNEALGIHYNNFCEVHSV